MKGDLEKADGSSRAGKITKRQKGMILIACILANFITLGTTQSFGIFQAHYGSEAAVRDGILQESQRHQKSLIASISSFGNGGTVALFGLIVIPLLPWIGGKIKFVSAAGTILMTLGLGTAAASTQLSHLVVTQGVLFGLGSGIVGYTLPPILAEYFSQHSGLAQGIAAAAGGLGGVFYAKVGDALLSSIQSRCTLLVFAAVAFVLGGIITLTAQQARDQETKSIRVVPWKAFTKPEFSLFMLVNLLIPLTLRTPATFGPIFSKSLGYDSSKAANLQAIMSLVSIPTRMAIGYVADRIGHQNAFMLTISVCAFSIMTLWLPAALTSDRTVWTVFVVFWGMFNGSYLQLVNSVGQRLFGQETYYLYNGAFTSMRGVGFVIGSPIAGAVLGQGGMETRPQVFVAVISFTGLLQILSAASLGVIRILDTRRRGWEWIR